MENKPIQNEKAKLKGEKTKIKPLQLYFCSKVLPGKSYISIGLPIDTPKVVQTKFYTKYEEPIDEIKVQNIKKSLEMKLPQETYSRPMTENQKYGWYHKYQISETATTIKYQNIDNPMLNFKKKYNPLIAEHLMNYAKIR